MSEYCFNPFYGEDKKIWGDLDDLYGAPDILPLHKSLPIYHATPLVSLPALAGILGMGKIFVKDESHRLGLKAFKALGASYAVYRFIKEEAAQKSINLPPPDKFYHEKDFIPADTYTFCTATDGNHGRGVAWVSRLLGQKAVIYMPGNSAQARVENIRSEGAKVIDVEGDYDDAVRQSSIDAEKKGWIIISDTSWPGYEKIPQWIMAGYTTLFKEIHELGDNPHGVDFIFVPGGVGALAACAAWYYHRRYKKSRVKLISVEPVQADCLLASIKSSDGMPVTSQGKLDSIMAGLNCGTPSPEAWPAIKNGFDLFMSIEDTMALQAMRTYYHSFGTDPRIISGESGAATLAALMTLCLEPEMSEVLKKLGMNSKSRILLLNTEGDTDPVFFNRTTAMPPDIF